MFRADIYGEQRGGAALGTSGAAVWGVGTFGEGVGGERLNSVATLGVSLKVTLGGGAVSRRWIGMMGDATLNFSGAVFSAGVER